jgi:hypothetical protein
MSFELLQVLNGQERERERERERKGVKEAFIPPQTEKSRYSSKTRNVRENPGYSGKSGDSG